MPQNRKEWSRARDGLAAAAASLGFPEEFGSLLARELGSPKAICRMTSWMYYEKPRSVELIVDEMLAIRAEIDAWREKAEGRNARAAYSYWLNSDTRARNLEDEESRCRG